jgi:hypothetical protein
MSLLHYILMHLFARWIGKSVPEGQTQTLDEQVANPSLAEGVARTISAHSESTREGQNLTRLADAVKKGEAKKEPIQLPETTRGK